MSDLLNRRANPRRGLRELLAGGQLVPAPGVYDAMSARLVEAAGFPAVYMSGFGVTASLLGRGPGRGAGAGAQAGATGGR